MNAPIVGIAATHDGKGYWLLGQDGGIFSYGNAPLLRLDRRDALNQPVVGIAPTPTGHGYWLVASDGGIFTFGDAHFYGSTGAMHLNQPIIGMAPTPSGEGLLARRIRRRHLHLRRRFHGSTGGSMLFSTIAGMASTKSGNGYWLAAADGRDLLVRRRARCTALRRRRRSPGSRPRRAETACGSSRKTARSTRVATRVISGGANDGQNQGVGIALAAHGYWVATTPSGPPLPPNSGSGRRIVYSNSQQRVWTVEANGAVSHTFLVSGRHGLPSAGVHQVYSKVPSSPSGNLTLPWTLRFAVSDRGNPIDFHGIPLEPNGTPIEPDSLLGTPQSHGCVRMNQADAKTLWDWATVGTVVVVTDIG